MSANKGWSNLRTALRYPPTAVWLVVGLIWLAFNLFLLVRWVIA